jgi:hypothetical protein
MPGLYAGAVPECFTVHDNWTTGSAVGEPGTSVIGGASNTYGSYTEILSDLPYDCYGLEIGVGSANVGGAACSWMMKLGIDPSGGTTYTTLEPLSDFIVGSPGQNTFVTGGVLSRFYFPLFIKAGSAVAVKWAYSNATAGRTINTLLRALCAPRDAHVTPTISKIVGYGIDNTNSTGTTVVPGTTSEGSWTEIGTVGAGEYPWWWQVVLDNKATSVVIQAIHVDFAIGDATNKKVVMQNDWKWLSSSEATFQLPNFLGPCHQASPGDKLYVRMWASSTLGTDYRIGVYGGW